MTELAQHMSACEDIFRKCGIEHCCQVSSLVFHRLS